MKKFLIALQFLTVFPVKIRAPIREKDFGASLLYFPLVGFLIGLLLSLTALLLSPFPCLIKAVIILIISIIVSGGIHLDGFADTCDGFYGNNPKEKVLEIMRDSRTGTMGVIGIVSLMLLKLSLFITIPEALLWKALIIMAVFSRWTQVLACYNASYARKAGKAKYFIEYARAKELFIGLLFTLILSCLLLKLKGLVLFLVCFLFTFLFLQYIKRRINGITGDTIGALSEFAEVSVLFFIFFIK